jgi:fimbrial chaperone protein
MQQRLLVSFVAASIALLSQPPMARAGSLSISPVRIDLSAKQRVGSLVVRNAGTEPTVVQLEVSGWTQSANEDLYGATQDLLATPPIFTVPPGGSQVVRIGLRRAQDPQQELTYRLFMQEILPPPATDFQGLRMALKVGVPVFVAASAKTRPELRWHLVSAGDQIRLRLDNSGTEHVKILDIALTAPASRHSATLEHIATYVLPGHSHEWLLKLDGPVATGSTIQVKAHTDPSSEVDASLTLDAS